MSLAPIANAMQQYQQQWLSQYQQVGLCCGLVILVIILIKIMVPHSFCSRL